MQNQQTLPERQSINEMVLRIYVGHFLRPNLTATDMIHVFDLVEQAPDGESRISTLIEKGYTRDLNEQHIKGAIELVNDYPEFINGYLSNDAILRYLADYQLQKLGKRSLTERVIGLNNAGFLDPTLTAGAMICVFDLIEHNDNGEERINRLIEEKCTGELTQEQIDKAIELLNDYPLQ